MFGQTFGHGTLRKYVIYFGTLFNNLRLNRYDADGNIVQNMKVPLHYGPREKYLARVDGNPNLDRQVAIQLPRMSFEMTGLTYDPTRKMQTLNKIKAANPNDPNYLMYQYAPVPYNIEFTLSIMVKNAEDGTFIIEQILPYFTPDWTATLNLNPDMGNAGKYDVPVTFDNISSEDQYEGDFTQRRALIWTLTFTMKGWMFGPTKTNGGKIIKEIDVNFRIPSKHQFAREGNPQNSGVTVNVDIKPGVAANGSPINTPIVTYSALVGNTTGIFEPGEVIRYDANNWAYVASANSEVIVYRNATGMFTSNTTITGETSGVTAKVITVEREPTEPVDHLEVSIEDDYGFIIDFTENI